MAILSAAFDLFAEKGYAAVSTRQIAARAGCGRQTIFRWWPSKADVLLEALTVKVDTHISIADQGSLRPELRAFLADSFALSRHPHVADLLCALMAESQTDPGFGARFYDGFLVRRRDALSIVLTRADRRGELPEHLRPDTMLDIVFGVIWYRMLATRQPLDDPLLDELLAILTGSAVASTTEDPKGAHIP